MVYLSMLIVLLSQEGYGFSINLKKGEGTNNCNKSKEHNGDHALASQSN